MALSQQVSDSLDDAKANLRNALSFAARTEDCLLYTSPSPRDRG